MGNRTSQELTYYGDNQNAHDDHEPDVRAWLARVEKEKQ